MIELNENTIISITVLSGIVGSIGSLFAAIAAFRSAGIAQQSIKHAQQVVHSSYKREILNKAQKVIFELEIIEELFKKLQITNMKITSPLNHSLFKESQIFFENNIRLMISLNKSKLFNAKQLLKNKDFLDDKKVEELVEELIRFEGYLGELLQIKEKINSEIKRRENGIA